MDVHKIEVAIEETIEEFRANIARYEDRIRNLSAEKAINCYKELIKETETAIKKLELDLLEERGQTKK